MDNIKKSSSFLLLYPFSFTYNINTFDNGGIFSLQPNTLPNSTSKYIFDFIKSETSANIGKSKALYDIDIAIFKLEDLIDNNPLDLFYDSDKYCSFIMNYIVKVNSCLLGKSEFLSYKASNPLVGGVVFVNHLDIINKVLFNSDGTNAINLLILPDHVAGSDSRIISLLTETGISYIKKFVNQGGEILATGKSGLLLEYFGLLNKDSYDTSKFLFSTSMIAKTIGCENRNNDFLINIMCMNNKNKTYLSSSYPMQSYSGYTKLLSINPSTSGLKYKNNDGDIINIENPSSIEFPFLLYRQVNKGKIVILNGNPLYDSGIPELFMNIFFEAMTKNVIINSYIDISNDNPIPAGE